MYFLSISLAPEITFLELAMSRHIKSPTRTISNRGPLPRFIGYFPCTKNDAEWLPFDSLSSLLVAIYLEWLKSVRHLSFEPHSYRHDDGEDAAEFISDYLAVSETGELSHFEAKYDREALKPEEKARLERIRQYFETRGLSYNVIFRTELEKNGFIQTICLLRRYGSLSFPDAAIKHAITKLKTHEPCTLAQYRKHAASSCIAIGLLYHVLYHQQLSLCYEPFCHKELLQCRV
jgi:hypothetical protein